MRSLVSGGSDSKRNRKTILVKPKRGSVPNRRESERNTSFYCYSRDKGVITGVCGTVWGKESERRFCYAAIVVDDCQAEYPAWFFPLLADDIETVRTFRIEPADDDVRFNGNRFRICCQVAFGRCRSVLRGFVPRAYVSVIGFVRHFAYRKSRNVAFLDGNVVEALHATPGSPIWRCISRILSEFLTWAASLSKLCS